MLINTTKDWGNVVRDRRLELGLTQEELAERVAKTRFWVLRFETGHAGRASVESLLKVLDALGLRAEVEADPAFDDPDPMFMDPSNSDPWENGS